MNLIGLKQIRQTELSGYILSVSSGIILGISGAFGNQLNQLLSGDIVSGFSYNLPTGVSRFFSAPYGYDFGNPPLFNLSVRNPYIPSGQLLTAYPISGFSSGCSLFLSAQPPVTGYTLDVFIHF